MRRDSLHLPGSIAIDTSLLLLVVGYQCLETERAKPHDRVDELSAIRGRDDNLSPARFDDLWKLFRKARRRIVTQHVIAETYGSRRRLASFRHQKELVWRSAIGLLTDPGIEEHSCSIRNLYDRMDYRAILVELGPADAGLIYVAAQQKATVITDDSKLKHWAGVRSVPAVLLSELGTL
jgi:predicted nucleic acid-binding protein